MAACASDVEACRLLPSLLGAIGWFGAGALSGKVESVQPAFRKHSPAGCKGLRLAQEALAVGLAYAAISVYWGLGGIWLVTTVSGSLERDARAVWAAAGLKTVAAILPLRAVRALRSSAPERPAWPALLWVLTWIEAAVLTLYGLVLTTIELLVHPNAVARVSRTRASSSSRACWSRAVARPSASFAADSRMTPAAKTWSIMVVVNSVAMLVPGATAAGFVLSVRLAVFMSRPGYPPAHRGPLWQAWAPVPAGP